MNSSKDQSYLRSDADKSTADRLSTLTNGLLITIAVQQIVKRQL